MRFKKGDQVVYECHCIPNNKVMTVTKASIKDKFFNQVEVMLPNGKAKANADELRLATCKEKQTGIRTPPVKVEVGSVWWEMLNPLG